MIFLFFLIFLLPILFFLLILPIGYLLYGFLNLLTVPLQIIEIAINKKLRKNHALEHATINVLEEKLRRKNIFSGYARENGFYVFGEASPDDVFTSSIEGRERLINGEKNLAIHNRCGTSIAVATFLTFITFLILLVITHTINIFLLLIAFLIGEIFGPALGKFTQEYFTTDSNVDDIKILDIEFNPTNIYGPFGITYPSKPSSFFIKTTEVKKLKII
ncbi:MAG: DUF6391 domain-containing protein [Caldisericia bacterium]